MYIDYKKYISHYGNLGLQEKLIAVWISWVPWAFYWATDGQQLGQS